MTKVPVNNTGWFTRLFLQRIWQPYIWIILAGFAVYGQALSFDYVTFDDDVLILDNYSFIGKISNLPSVFGQKVLNHYYRPVQIASYMIDAWLGGKDPYVYHFTNIILHLAASCLLFAFLAGMGYSRDKVFLLAMLFSVHPLFTQVVSWIPGRGDLLLSVFALGFFVILRKMLHKDYKPRPAAALRHTAMLMLLFLLSLFTKESGIALLAMAGLCMVIFGSGKIFNTQRIFFFIAYGVVILLWMSMRKHAVGTSAGQDVLGTLSITLSGLPAIVPFTGKFFIPAYLTVMPVMPDLSFIYGFMTLLLLAALPFFTNDRRWKYIFFGLAWFLVFLLPTFIRADPKGEVHFYEHRMYLPSVGLMVILLELFPFRNLPANSRALLFSCGAVFLVFALININYSRNFSDKFHFWEKAAKGSPHSSVAHIGAGNVYYLEGDLDRTVEEYRKYISLKEGDAITHYNLAEPEIHYNLGAIYLRQGKAAEAKKEFLSVTRINPEIAEAYFKLGMIYNNESKADSAAMMWQKCTELDPRSTDAYNNLALLSYNAGQTGKAAVLWQKVLSLRPASVDVIYNLALLYSRQNSRDSARAYVRLMKQGGIDTRRLQQMGIQPDSVLVKYFEEK